MPRPCPCIASLTANRHFGPLRLGRGAIVSGEAAQRAGALGDDQHVVGIGRDDAPRLRQIDAVRRHETIVEAALGEAGEERDDGVGIEVADGAQTERCPVPKDDVGVEFAAGNRDRHGNRKSTGEARSKVASFPAFRPGRRGAAGNPAAVG